MKKIENGAYILSATNSLIPAGEISKHVFEKGFEPQYVILVTDYGAIKIDKDIKGLMTYDKAIKYDLPNTVQGHLIGLNKNILKPAIEAIGGTWTDDWCWCKTEYNSYNAWFYYGFNGSLGNYNKGNSPNVRPVTAFQILSDSLFESPKETKTSKKSNSPAKVNINTNDLELERLKLGLTESFHKTPFANGDIAMASLLARNIIDSNKALFLTLADNLNGK